MEGGMEMGSYWKIGCQRCAVVRYMMQKIAAGVWLRGG